MVPPILWWRCKGSNIISCIWRYSCKANEFLLLLQNRGFGFCGHLVFSTQSLLLNTLHLTQFAELQRSHDRSNQEEPGAVREQPGSCQEQPGSSREQPGAVRRSQRAARSSQEAARSNQRQAKSSQGAARSTKGYLRSSRLGPPVSGTPFHQLWGP